MPRRVRLNSAIDGEILTLSLTGVVLVTVGGLGFASSHWLFGSVLAVGLMLSIVAAVRTFSDARVMRVRETRRVMMDGRNFTAILMQQYPNWVFSTACDNAGLGYEIHAIYEDPARTSRPSLIRHA